MLYLAIALLIVDTHPLIDSSVKLGAHTITKFSTLLLLGVCVGAFCVVYRVLALGQICLTEKLAFQN